MRVKISVYIIICKLLSLTSCIEAINPPQKEDKSKFEIGVHFNQWFEASSTQQINFNKYSKVDFVNLKKLGGNILRLPVNFQAFTKGAPDYKIDSIFFKYLDKAVSWAEEMNINIIIDNHTFYKDGSVYYTIEPQLSKIWDQVSLRYRNRSNLIMYEICNEPHDVDDYVWGRIQQNIINVIRKNDSIHTIIVNPAGWSSYNNLKKLPEYKDTNLIYDFHFYDPMIFTHQSASFVTPKTTNLKNVPFPYDQARMPDFPDDLKGTWFETSFKNYQEESRIERLKSLIDIAVDFRETRKVRIYCGELGVHIPGAPPEDRVLWYQTICSYLKEKDIPFTIWDYKDVFGIFDISGENPGRRWFPDDLNLQLIKAIGFEDPTIKK